MSFHRNIWHERSQFQAPVVFIMNRTSLGFFVLWLLMPLLAHANLVELENRRLGTSEWQLGKLATNGEIEGYASLTSVNRGAKIRLFVNIDYVSPK